MLSPAAMVIRFGRSVGKRSQTSQPRFFGGFIILLMSVSTAKADLIIDPAARGPFEVESKEYRLPSVTDADILEDRQTEIWARVFYPKDLNGSPRPLVGFLHGNHGTCGSGSNPREDHGRDYTTTGACPDGSVVTPNHEGYNYIAEHLASYGYIVFSINANRGITGGSGVEGDYGLNLARGRLVLKHLMYWNQWNSVGGAPESLGRGANGFVGKVDLAHVGLMGHSRGGEGVRAALTQYQDAGSPWIAKIPGLKIEGIFEIGAVDGQTDRVLNASKVAWNQLIPACDGDVSDLEGINPYNRMLLDRNEPKTAQKSVTIIYGANHNFFNTEWQTSDAREDDCFNQIPIFNSDEISSAKQQAVARTLMTHFYLANVGAVKHPEFNSVFNSAIHLRDDLRAITQIDRDFVISPSDGLQLRFDDFQGAANTGVAYEPSTNVSLDPAEAFDGKILSISWEAGEKAEVSLNRTTPVDASVYATLDFRFSLPSGAKFEVPVDFQLSLVDASGARSNPVSITKFVQKASSPQNYGWLFETVRIPSTEFIGVNLAALKSVHLAFDSKTPGQVALANVRFSRFLAMGPADLFSPPTAPETQSLLAGLGETEASRARSNRLADFFSRMRQRRDGKRAHEPIVRSGRTKVLGIREAVSTTQWSQPQRSRPAKRYAEIVLVSDVKFPMRNSLPVLTVGQTRLKMSDIAMQARNGRISFALPEALRESLRGQKLPVKLHYEGRPGQVWQFGEYSF